MEKTLDQNPAKKAQDENLNQNSHVHGAAVICSVANKASKLNNEEKFNGNLIKEEKEAFNNCECPELSSQSSEKVSSTLLQSAFKVMKTLFSPEKAKNKPSNSVNQHKSASESSNSNSHLADKQKPITLEPGAEVPSMKSALSQEHNFKDKNQLNAPMLLSPLLFDFQSNDDDSFLTTISYDESFQSAVTHFDENGEVIKHCENLSNSIFNNSQDLDLVESCSSSLENSECCLENTMLKNDSHSPEELSHIDLLSKNTNGNNKALNEVKNHGHNNVEVSNTDTTCQASKVQTEVFKCDHPDSSTQTHDESLRQASDFSVRYSAVNGTSNKIDFYETGVNSPGLVLNNQHPIPGQTTEPGFQQLVKIPGQCSSNKSECEKAFTKNNVVHSEKANIEFVEVKKIESDDKLAFLSEKALLQNGPGGSTVHLTKSDLNQVDEMLLALKKNETTSSLNSLNGNYISLTETKNAHLNKSLDSVYMDKKLMKTEENTQSDISFSPSNIRVDKFLDENYVCNGSQSSLGLLLNHSEEAEKEKQVDSQKEDFFNLTKNPEEVGHKNNSELKFEKSYTYPGSIPQESCSKLELSRGTSLQVSASNSLAVTPTSNTMTSEIVENNEDSEGAKLFLGEERARFSLKHSTPVSVLNACGSTCSSTQNLDMDSSHIDEKNDNDKGNSRLHSAQSDFLGKAMGIFRSDESPYFVAEIPDEKYPNFSVSGESFGSGIWIRTLNPPNEFVEPSEIKHEPRKLMQDSGSPASRRSELSSETTPKTAGEKEPELPPVHESFNKKPESFDSEKSGLCKTVDVHEWAKAKESNFEVSTTPNKTNDTVRDYLELSLNKKTDATKAERQKSELFNDLNGTNVKITNTGKDLEYDVKDLYKNSGKSCGLGFISEQERSGYPGSQEAQNFLSPMKESPQFIISENLSLTESIEDNSKNVDAIYIKNKNNSFLNRTFSPSPPSKDNMGKSQILTSGNQVVEDLSGKLKESCPSDVLNEIPREFLEEQTIQAGSGEPNVARSETLLPPKFASHSKSIEHDLAQLIEQQFTPSEIAKICDVANLSENLSSLNLKANEKEKETPIKVENVLSPKSFDFLNSIQGKPTGRDLSRESLYVKFDPLVQPPTANSLIDFTKEVEVLAASEAASASHNSSICEELLAISPEKKSDIIVPPLTPMSDRNKKDKFERQKELQNEIYFLKNLYSERERVNKSKMEEYESQIAKLTGDKCVLEDKLKEYGEREKSIVKKMTGQAQDIEHLKTVMKEYVKMISVLTTELETMRKDNDKQIEALSAEKDSYMNHLQNTEAAFSDVHTKYEKSKKTIESLKMNEVMYRKTISEHAQKMEEYKKKAKETQEKALGEFQSIMLELEESKSSHSQEVSRLRAQLKKTELKLEAVQESLDQKIKENQQLTAICDELIEGKK